MFSCEFCKIFKSTFFYRTPTVAASESTAKHEAYSRRRVIVVFDLWYKFFHIRTNIKACPQWWNNEFGQDKWDKRENLSRKISAMISYPPILGCISDLYSIVVLFKLISN